LTQLTVPDTVYSSVVAVAADGRIAGNLMVKALIKGRNVTNEYAFTWQDGVLTVILPSPAIQSHVVAMNPSGEIILTAGGYPYSQFPFQVALSLPLYTGATSFVWRDGESTPLSQKDPVTGVTSGITLPMAINAAGDIAGYTEGGAAILHDGVFSYITFPDHAITYPPRMLLSDSGVLAGQYNLSSSDWRTDHCFTWVDGQFRDFTMPGVWINAIDDAGEIFGIYTPPPNEMGSRLFLLKDGVVTLIPSGDLMHSQSLMIQRSGRVLGSYDGENLIGWRLFTWLNGTITQLPSPGGTYHPAQVFAMNASGQPVGLFGNSNEPVQALTWKDGNPELLFQRGVSSSSARSINDAGQIAGEFTDRGGPEGADSNNGYAFFIEADGTVEVILPPFAPEPIYGPDPTPIPTPSATPTPAPEATPISTPGATPTPTPEAMSTPMPTPDVTVISFTSGLKPKDKVRPWLSVDKVNRRPGTQAAVLRGQAADDRKLTRVEISQNGGAYRKIRVAAGRWQGSVRLEPGRNILLIRAVDASDNRSKVKRVVVRQP
jgi:uncharacterized membrane protein